MKSVTALNLAVKDQVKLMLRYQKIIVSSAVDTVI